jgi:TonB-dependent SusC/RagA subfamily outer membrane receptor
MNIFMIRNISKLLVAIGCSLFLFAATSVAQEKAKKTIISLTIVDNTGKPIQGATVSGDFGVSSTDYAGKCYIKSDGSGIVYVEKTGFKPLNLPLPNLKDKLTLEKAEFLASEGDVVNMGFIQQKKRDIVTSVTSLKPDDRITYDNTESALNHVDGMLTGLRAGSDIRGLGSAMYVIDGIPGRDVNLVDASEIDQITVLKDVNALALFGSEGKNGVIVVTTKRGLKNRQSVKINATYGLKEPISYPNYLNAPDYMTLYNEARKNDGLNALYDSTSIANTRSGLNPYLYPNLNLYSSDYLKSSTEQKNIMAEFSGGNKNLQYYVNLDFKSNGTLEKLNPDVNKPSRTYKVRGNLDFAINSWIKATVDVMTSINSQKSAYNNILSVGTSFLPNLYAPLLPVSMISKNSLMQQQMSTINTYDGYILGGSQSYTGNIPFANILAKGYTNVMNINSQVANTVCFDLSKITKGLSGSAYFFCKQSIQFLCTDLDR